MDIQNIKNLADTAFNHSVHRKNLKERAESKMAVAHNGGMFKASMELYTFLRVWDEPHLYLEDMYGNPVQVDQKELLAKVTEAFMYAMNDWYVEFAKAKLIRKGSDV